APSPPLATWPLTPVLPRSRDDLGPRFAVNSRLGLAINSSRMPSADRHGWPRATTPHPRPTTIANARKERNTTPRVSAWPADDSTSCSPSTETATPPNLLQTKSCSPLDLKHTDTPQ